MTTTFNSQKTKYILRKLIEALPFLLTPQDAVKTSVSLPCIIIFFNKFSFGPILSSDTAGGYEEAS